VKVELVRGDGRPTVVDIDPSETVLDAAEAAGESLPFGCRTGACGTCTGRLLQGSVEHTTSPLALKGRHREAGYVLPCIAEPRTDCRIRVGTSVARELVANPFR
jgi:ferredoxin